MKVAKIDKSNPAHISNWSNYNWYMSIIRSVQMTGGKSECVGLFDGKATVMINQKSMWILATIKRMK